MLSVNVQSASELMSIALHAEHEAVRRYTRLAREMRSQGNQEAAALFERMVDEEQQHEHLIEAWSQGEHIQLRTDIGPIVWEDPQVATVYDSEAVDPVRSSTYRALAFAVHNEERAFRFYTHVAANTEDGRVREYAEILAREELGHAALLRAMRRRAWRAERDSSRDEPDIQPGTINSLADLLAVAAGIERCLAGKMSDLSESYPELRETGTATQRSLAAIETRLKAAGKPGAGIADSIAALERYTGKTTAAGNDASQSLQRLCADGDRCFALYDAVVARVQDETVMLAAQELSESALARVHVLQNLFESSRQQLDRS